MSESTWKVGPLAEACGLTVRTLHHWDTIGLLTPSRRTAGGHREYTEDDVERLYQVLALRGLGLGLDTIAVCLEAGVDPTRVLRDHRESVEAHLAALTTLRDRLLHIEEEVADGRPRTTAAVLDALRATGAAEGAVRRHLDDEQMTALGRHAAAVGPAAHYLLEVEWPELYRRAEESRVSGTPPTDPRVRRIAARMDELSALFSGGDRTLSAGVRAAWREDPAALSGDASARPGRWDSLTEYLAAAR
ncbi:MerR family transcriptional regulator [Streptomyces sp. NBC_00083]|uniref:MerR family transcriptional regulator n=1 Tax=Streptomyces sp. NBC_00083 TaxID=2975647 RepID=UPI00225746E1|nr:MerR family transcriptional regulator [Streptomyces sp. NBC_00083]MCX5382284.1 MerR family transcriptional regulator [Streptomyces sp. NBC_00083]